MSDETRNKLISALRQFRHNNDNTGSITRPEQGFVFAYDRDETEGLVASLEKKLEQAEARCAELESAVPWTIYGDNLTATVLRKQAEAVLSLLIDHERKGVIRWVKHIEDAANRLRQQATEIESGGGDE